jgi:triphosphoribosyl-dephospho-CoA synthase
MVDPLALIRNSIDSPSDAVRWACLLEATAPKPGNVYPGRSFRDLQYRDFVAAAEIVASAFSRTGHPISQRMRSAVELSVAQLRTNANLGIVLLLGPLVAADETMTSDTTGQRNDQRWTAAIAEVLSGFNGADGRNIFQAINNASAGGLGDVDAMDVRESHPRVDIVEAMTLAADRDLIARQYATGFMDLIERILPLVGESIRRRGDLLGGIVDAHLRMLANEPDSLIARKNGFEVASSVQKRAQNVDLDDPASISVFDESLRSGTSELNPGTTADLIAAALYMLLRTPDH